MQTQTNGFSSCTVGVYGERAVPVCWLENRSRRLHGRVQPGYTEINRKSLTHWSILSYTHTQKRDDSAHAVCFLLLNNEVCSRQSDCIVFTTAAQNDFVFIESGALLRCKAAAQTTSLQCLITTPLWTVTWITHVMFVNLKDHFSTWKSLSLS